MRNENSIILTKEKRDDMVYGIKRLCRKHLFT
jgi:hypothetical protein